VARLIAWSPELDAEIPNLPSADWGFLYVGATNRIRGYCGSADACFRLAEDCVFCRTIPFFAEKQNRATSRRCNVWMQHD
jgi:hypothetical protein